LGFVDEQARLSNKQRIATKVYHITSEYYDIYFAADAQNPEGKNPYSAAYELANAVLEGEPPTEGEPDLRISFFHNAVNV
jgi:hypothetical protein